MIQTIYLTILNFKNKIHQAINYHQPYCYNLKNFLCNDKRQRGRQVRGPRASLTRGIPCVESYVGGFNSLYTIPRFFPYFFPPPPTSMARRFVLPSISHPSHSLFRTLLHSCYTLYPYTCHTLLPPVYECTRRVSRRVTYTKITEWTSTSRNGSNATIKTFYEFIYIYIYSSDKK